MLRKIVGKKVASILFKRAGGFVGRLIPGIGWGLLAKDAWDNREEIKAFTEDVRKENEENRDNILWHVR